MKVFPPSMTYASPSRRAAVFSPPASLPAPGSERPYAPIFRADSRSGRYRDRSASGPPISMAGPQSPADPPMTFQSDAFGRATGLTVDHHLDRRGVGAVHAIGAVDRVFERPGRVPDLTDADFDVVLVVETQRRLITHAGFADREVNAIGEQVALVDHPELAEVRDASDLREQQIVRVVDDPLQVRLTKAHPLTMRERKIHGRLAG